MAATEAESQANSTQPRLPPGFGVCRYASSGAASHELIYEYDYHPTPIRKFSVDKPEVCSGCLRPAVRQARVAFSYFGGRVPLSADHARCWLGAVLLEEASYGRLSAVELHVPAEGLKAAKDSGTVWSEASPRMWLWTVRATRPGAAPSEPVAVEMFISSSDGVRIETRCKDEKAHGHVFRVLRQYCDSEADSSAPWHPIPATCTKISKVQDRAMPSDLPLKQLLGASLPEKAVGDLGAVVDIERRIMHLLDRLEATCAAVPLAELLPTVQELYQALYEGLKMGLKITTPRSDLACRYLEVMLSRLVADGKAERLQMGTHLAGQIHRLGVCRPEGLEAAEGLVMASRGPPAPLSLGL